MAASFAAPLVVTVASRSADSTTASDDWMFVSAIGAAMLLFTLVVMLCVRRPR